MKYFQNRHAESKATLARLLRSLGAMIVGALMSFAVSIPAANAQDPPQYELTWIDNIFNPNDGVGIRDINEDGVVVGDATGFELWSGDPNVGVKGWHRAIMYEQVTGMQNLNDLDGVLWTDLITTEPLIGNPWIAHIAYGINENGQIVGTAINRDYEDRVFVLNFPETGPPEFILLPRFGNGGNGGAAINDQGIVVGSAGWGGSTIVFDPLATPPYEPVEIPGMGTPRDINNLGVIVTSNSPEYGTSVITPSVNPQTGTYDYTQAFVDDDFPNDTFYGINDSGMICGKRNRITRGPPSERQDGGAFRFQYLDPFLNPDPGEPTEADLLNVDTGDAEASGRCDVNDFGDVCFGVDYRGWVYLEGVGIFNLDDQITFDSSQDESDWMSRRIFTQRINDIGQIIIYGGALLTPVTSDPTPGITVTPTSGLITTEAVGGDPASFYVVLDTPPSDNVTIGIGSDDSTEGTTDVTSLTFTPANWDTPQTVTVTGADDQDIDGDVAYTIVTAAATSNDPDYNGMDPDDVDVTNLDDEQPPIVTYDSTDTPLAIPDNDPAGVSSTILVTDDFQIADLTVTLDISHQRHSDLDVYLIGPNNSQVQLFNFSGDNSAPDFNGTSTFGLWTLEVYDTRNRKTGTLNSWSMTVEH